MLKILVTVILLNTILFVDSGVISGPKQSKIHEISVKAITGEIQKFKLSEDQTVEDLKRMIMKITDIPVEKQILFFRSEQLDDSQPLRMYKMDRKVTVELFLRYF
ncbi:uncharacterized protein LOC123320821 [Coccinella septempunctata]|uniref:uncharacterized protein LOC123320821 n=1 Tax=Coccinella septempunctata TaxID=41139 RepID=UPI001D0837AE|nr:uncharacterized protein LOC123320821 [Coccinella septempunctata]